ncbi:MAG TPA: PBP1A family penicillin-binding protein [Polyangiaceae bacterium]|nr:PBP1A family penicillin-binding protein [Polyangiaceae bacterium]
MSFDVDDTDRDPAPERKSRDRSSKSKTPPKPSAGKVAWKWAQRILVTLLLLGGVAMTAVALAVRHYEAQLPANEDLRKYTPPQVTRILARDGSLLGEDYVERRTVVKLDDIPAHVKLAFLAAEDASFYEHEGLDYPGMLRAMYKNLRSQSSKQGASTITQQVVKNVLLTQDRTYERKIKEVILSRRMEQEMSKDEILEIYLNQIYFGHGRYGVEEASRYYFGKGVAQLSLAEAAILASIPKGPTIYSPREHLDRAVERSGYVLRQMEEKGFATPDAIARAKEEKIVIAPETNAAGELAPEVIAEARRTLRDVVGAVADKGGYTVMTTIDPKLEASARKALRDALDAHAKRQKLLAPVKKPKGKVTYYEGDPAADKQPTYVAEVTGADDAKNELFVRVGTLRGRVSLAHEDRYNPDKLPASKFAEVGAPLRVSVLALGKTGEDGVQTTPSFSLELGAEGAVVLVDARTREIVAMVGGYEGQRGALDRATNAHRQPGSTFKPFTYSYAIHSKKLTPASLVPIDPAALEGYRPKNYDKKGGEPVRMRYALANSINVAAAWIIGQVGPANVAAWASSLGIESKLGATPSLALGAYEVTPRELANAYATFASGGMVESSRLVSKIVGPDGTEIPLPPREEPHRAMTPAEAYVTTDLLKSVVNEGTGKGAKVLRRPIAGKTGTSNEVRDAWFAGYSTDYACVAWVGFDDRKPLGAGESGAVAALPIFVELMRTAHQGLPATDFSIPDGVSRASIDPKTGLLARDGQDDAMTEVFLAGTEPTETAKDPSETTDAPPQDGAVPSGEGGDEAKKPADTVPVEEPPPAL